MKFLKDNWKLLALLASALVIYSYPALLVPVASSTAALILTSYLSKVFGLFGGKKAVSTEEPVKEAALSNDLDVIDCSTSKMVAELSANDENIVVAADAPVVAPVVAREEAPVVAREEAQVVAREEAQVDVALEHLSVSSSDEEDEEAGLAPVAGR